ncbi:AsmA family protein [Agarivorans sp. TSD2052]|uniref:AsmA family protein n=1 Tax=Agarivorans sp. TSD2052 TaxID=2937286 RepID=UPI0020109342|nr:AsmA family protein [Agarivorans sp. TSD2052]UPW17077.1 AsmA family protein [Agarivorans sp. TSD2052]
MKRWVKRSLISTSVLLAILLLPIAILVVGIKLEIGDSRQLLTNLLSEQLQRDVRITGDISIELSFIPAITVEQIDIANPSGFNQPYFAQVRKASAQLRVLPLINRHLQIEQVLLDGFHLALIRNDSGENNWQFTQPNKAKAAPSVNQSSHEEEGGSFSWQGINYSFDINQQILISDAQISYQNQAAEALVTWRLDELKLTSPDSDTLAMTAFGSMLDETYALQSRWQLEPLLQGRAGDVELNMQVADAQLNLSGEIAPQSDQNSHLELSLDWQNPDSIARLLGDEFAQLAPITLVSRFDGKPGEYSLTPMNASLGSSHLNGELTLKGDSPLEINGNLNIDQIDLSPWLALAQDDMLSTKAELKSKPVQAPLASTAASESESLPLLQIIRYWLNQADVDLSLKVASIEGLPLEVSAISIGLKVEGESLKAPLRAVIDDVRFNGNLKASIHDERLETSMRLVAKKSPLDKLASRIPMLAGSSGNIGRSVLKINANGTTIAELLANSHFDYNIENSQMLLPAGTALNIQHASLTASVESEVLVKLDGILLDIPVNAVLHASPLRAMLDNEPWRLDMQLHSPAIELQVKGELPSGQWQQGASLSLNAEGERIGLLSPWLGVDTNAQGALKLALELQASRGQSSLNISHLQLADSQGELQASWSEAKTEQGLVTIKSNWQRIDVAQLMALMPSGDVAQNASQLDAQAATVAKNSIDIRLPILPKGWSIHDADLALNIKQLLIGEHQLKQLTLTAVARDGWLQKAPFSAELADSKFVGNALLDLRASPLKLDFTIASQQPNVGQILKQFNIAEQAKIELDSAELALSLSGNNVAQLLASTQFSAKLKGGYWLLVDPNTQASARVELSEGSLTANPEQPITLALSGQLKQLPLTLSLSTLSLREFTQKPSALPIHLSLELAEVALSAQANLPRPISAQNLTLAVQLSSPKLSQLDRLHGIELPPFGPIKLAGELVLSPQGYAINDMLLAIASSELTGGASLVTSGNKPLLELAVSANNIQLDDFKTGGWQGWAHNSDQQPAANQQDHSSQQTAVNQQPAPATQALLSQELFKRLNAKFRLDVEKVQSGEDWLGQGKLYWSLQDQRFRLDPLWIALPGGELNVSAELSPSNAGFYSELKASIENFDYGLLARRIKPETKMGGTLSVNLEVNSEFVNPKQWFADLNGQVGFAIWPQHFEAGILDLWAVSLASAVVPELDDAEKSVLNCVVAVFDGDHGELTKNVLLADTSRMRVLGEASIDFKQQQVNMVLRPQAKRAQIFGLATPIQVSGSFEDFNVGVANGGLLGTTLRFVTSPVVSPLRWIVEAPLDANGSELCLQAWQQAKQTPSEQ